MPDAPATAEPAGSPAAPPTAPPTPTPDPYSLQGTWAGELEFTDSTIHLTDKQAVAMAREAIAKTLGRPYPIGLVIGAEVNSGFDVTLDVGGTLNVEGDGSGYADDFAMTFHKAGDRELEVGASPPISFTFIGPTGGALGDDPDRIGGTVRYEVFTSKGEPAWTETGTWSARRQP
jgi:hypothetical protein